MNASLFLLVAVVFIDLLGFGIVIPILPYYAESFGASAFWLGLLMMSYSLMQFLFSPVWGTLSDRYGRKPILVISIFLTAISLAGLASAKTLVFLMIARTLSGIFSANISTAFAYVADLTDEKNRAKGMGLIGAGFGMGFIFGPAIGGLLSRYGYSTPIWLAAGLALLNGFFAIKVLREPARLETRRRRVFDLDHWKKALSLPGARIATPLFFLLTLAVTQLEVTFALYLKDKFALSAWGAGGLLATMGTLMAVMQGGVAGRLAQRVKLHHILISGFALGGVALVGFGLSQTLVGVVVSLVFLAVSHGTLHPTLSTLASLGTVTSQRGLVMGVFQSASSLARVVGPPLAGYLFDQTAHPAPFFCGSALLCMGLVVAIRFAPQGARVKGILTKH